jgi:hypothetical protein
MEPMANAPRDRTIKVLGPKGWRRARYRDCKWLRIDFEVIPGRVIPGDPDVADCWAVETNDGDIELTEARGWKPAAQRR